MKHLQIYSSHNNYIDSKYSDRIDYCQFENHLHYTDIQFVDKITTVGTSWIDLPFNGSTITDAVRMIFQQSTNQNQLRFVGPSSENSGLYNIYINGSGGFAYSSYNSSGTASWNAINNNSAWLVKTYKWDFKIDYYNKTSYFTKLTDNTTYTKSITRSAAAYAVPSSNLRIFGILNTYPRFKGDLYRFQYWSNNELILDMFPARIGTEGIMFDIIEKKIYKSGNVPFTPGTDVNTIDLNS